jgi:uncharacterized protein YndB with AHSA1/START domain
MRDEGGALHGVLGVYTQVEPPERLGFTWTWENEPAVMRGSERSLVEVALQEAPGGTQVTLTHSGLDTKLVKDMHEEGWNALLTSLFRTLSFLRDEEGPASSRPGLLFPPAIRCSRGPRGSPDR